MPYAAPRSSTLAQPRPRPRTSSRARIAPDPYRPVSSSSEKGLTNIRGGVEPESISPTAGARKKRVSTAGQVRSCGLRDARGVGDTAGAAACALGGGVGTGGVGEDSEAPPP